MIIFDVSKWEGSGYFWYWLEKWLGSVLVIPWHNTVATHHVRCSYWHGSGLSLGSIIPQKNVFSLNGWRKLYCRWICPILFIILKLLLFCLSTFEDILNPGRNLLLLPLIVLKWSSILAWQISNGMRNIRKSCERGIVFSRRQKACSPCWEQFNAIIMIPVASETIPITDYSFLLI